MSDPFHHARVANMGIGYRLPRYRGDDAIERVLGKDGFSAALFLLAAACVTGIAFASKARRPKPRRPQPSTGYRLPFLPS